MFYFYFVIFVDFGRSITIIVIIILNLQPKLCLSGQEKNLQNNYSRLKHVFYNTKYNKTRPRVAMMNDNSVPSLFVETP